MTTDRLQSLRDKAWNAIALYYTGTENVGPCDNSFEGPADDALDNLIAYVEATARVAALREASDRALPLETGNEVWRMLRSMTHEEEAK